MKIINVHVSNEQHENNFEMKSLGGALFLYLLKKNLLSL